MAEQRVNGLGQTVEFDENSGRWSKVVDREAEVETEQEPEQQVEETEEEATPAPAELTPEDRTFGWRR